MILKSSYYYFTAAIPKEICQRIIQLGVSKIEEYEKTGKLAEAVTFNDTQKGANLDSAPAKDLTKADRKEKKIDNAYERDSKVAWLNDQWLYDMIYPYIDKANKDAGWNWQWDYSEQFQFTVYTPGGFYSWHADGPSDHNGIFKRYIYGVTPTPLKPDGRVPEGYAVDDNMVGKVRKLSLTINLNEPGEYEGGELKFDHGQHNDGDQIVVCDEIKPQGSIVVFPSFIPHCVSPVTQGTRYSLVLWTLGYPFK
jgi:PKHD-type hydroxylase